jgi:hypothetical protein
MSVPVHLAKRIKTILGHFVVITSLVLLIEIITVREWIYFCSSTFWRGIISRRKLEAGVRGGTSFRYLCPYRYFHNGIHCRNGRG